MIENIKELLGWLFLDLWGFKAVFGKEKQKDS
jgi:hypothetical protein